ncbi:MAG: hypothetical protein CSB16_02520 [Clostridiales bacterium]|nr:MAG: hypothetical protein CSB16_02520 [Clostridiales bacterium]
MIIFSSCTDKASDYPSRNITIIVPYGAGGTTDNVARHFAEPFSKALGEEVVIVNQSGASGSVGTIQAYDAEADGYTLLFSADSLGTQRVMGLSDKSYSDFSTIMAVANDPKVVVVSKDSKFETLESLLGAMKDGKNVSMSYTGPGGSGHVQSIIYNKLGMDMNLISYSGGMDCILAVMGGQVDFTNSNFSTVKEYIKSGDLKLLGVFSSERLLEYPDVKTVVEVLPEASKYLDLPFTPLSLQVNKNVPEDVKKILKEAARESVKDEKWINFVRDNSIETLYDKYESEEEVISFFKKWESTICWMLYDSGASKYSPEKFGIERINEEN